MQTFSRFGFLLLMIMVLFNESMVNGQPKKDGRLSIPAENPVSKYNLSWTDEFRWDQVFSIEDAEGKTMDEKFEFAQNRLAAKGGGVIYFPVGTYYFLDHLRIKSGIVIRGAEPVNSEKHNPIVPHEFPKAIIDAREPRYTLGTHFVFPEYNPVFNGNRTDRNKAFKGIRVHKPQHANFCGIVNINLTNGHIALGEKQAMQENYANGVMYGNFLVYGCILTNAAVAADNIPQDFQHPWQVFPSREHGAITIFGCKNVLVANNRIPESAASNFLMRNYRVYLNSNDMKQEQNVTGVDVWFDYENRTGIRVNFMPLLHQLSIWDIHEELQDAVKNGNRDEFVAPGGLAKGIVIRNNYIYTSGRGGIKTTGDGAYVAFNVIRCRPNVVMPTANGLYMDAHVNDVRGIEVRGWRWTVEGNDYEVHSNYTPAGIKYNDGEGIMHESWENTGIRESKIINNVGNRYICVWRVPTRGLIVEGNRLRIKQNWHSIFINSQSRPNASSLIDLPCEDVILQNNITEGGGIKMVGTDGKGNAIIHNKHTVINEGKIENHVNAKVEGNENYEIIDLFE